MSTDQIKPKKDVEPGLHEQIPHLGRIVFGVVALVIAALAFYLPRRTYEHAAMDKYIGPGRCKECHRKQFESWGKTRMANSFSVLRPGEKAAEKRLAGLDPAADYTHNESCLPCHTTGYGLVGGFVSIEQTPEMAGVTCESCHGPGGSYAGTVMASDKPMFKTTDARKSGLVYPPTEEVCRVCHNTNSPFVGKDYKFDFAERVKLGTHEHLKLNYEHGK